MDYKEFAAKIKEKRPDYADVDDRELAEKIVAKYPDYKDTVTFDSADTAQAPAPQGFGAGLKEAAMQGIKAALPDPESYNQPITTNASNPVMGALDAATQSIVNPSRLSPSMSAPGQAAGDVVSEKLGGGLVGGAAGFLTGVALDPQNFTNMGAAAMGKVAPKDIPALEKEAARFGLRLTKGELLNSKPLLLLERALENTPGGSKVLKTFREQRLEQLTKLRDTLVSRNASPEALEKIGLEIQDVAAKVLKNQEAAQAETVQGLLQRGANKLGTSTESSDALAKKALDSIKAKSREAKDEVSRAFDEVEQLIPQNFADVPAKTLEVAKELKKWQSKAAPSLRNKRLLGILNDFIPNYEEGLVVAGQKLPEPTLTWGQMKASREALTQLINEADGAAAFGVKGGETVDSAVLKRLKSALADDMDAMANKVGPDAAEKYSIARAMHGEFKQTFNNDTVRSLIKIADQKPERFIETVFAPKRTTEIKNIRRIMGADRFNAMRDRFTTKLFGLDEVGGFNPSRLRQQINHYGKEMLTETYGAGSYEDLAKLANTVEKIGSMPLNNPFARSIVKRSPEQVMKFVIRPGNTTNILKAKSLIGGEKWNEATASWLDQEVLAKNPEALTNPAQLANLLKDYGEDTLKLAMGDRNFKSFKRIAALSRLIQRGEQISVNTSQTAGVGGMMGMLTHPVTAVMKMVGSQTVAKWYLDPKASAVLIEGLGAMPKTRAAIDASRRLLALSANVAAQASSDKPARQ